MRRLLNTLFVLTEDAYLALENENVVVKQGEKVLGRVPLLTLESIIDFSISSRLRFTMQDPYWNGHGVTMQTASM